MPSATVTSKGQLTLPKAIRDRLHVNPGDTVEFVIEDSGQIHVRAGSVDVRDLRGLLRKPGRQPVTLDAMEEAIRTARARRP